MLNGLIQKHRTLVKKKKECEVSLENTINELKETESILRKLCSHCWITDYIDCKNGEGSHIIKYCEICEIIQ